MCVPVVVLRILALDFQLMRTLTLDLWPWEALPVIAPQVPICQAGAVEGSTGLEYPLYTSCPPHWASHTQDLIRSSLVATPVGHL